MKNKTKILLLVIFLLVIIAILVFYLLAQNNKVKKDNEPCYDITGGGYNLIFETNGGEHLDLMRVCIACSPDSYSSLPIPIKNGHKFLGWYYDEKLTEKVEVTSTLNIEPIPDYKDECIIGYKDITLYASWD